MPPIDRKRLIFPLNVLCGIALWNIFGVHATLQYFYFALARGYGDMRYFGLHVSPIVYLLLASLLPASLIIARTQVVKGPISWIPLVVGLRMALSVYALASFPYMVLFTTSGSLYAENMLSIVLSAVIVVFGSQFLFRYFRPELVQVAPQEQQQPLSPAFDASSQLEFKVYKPQSVPEAAISLGVNNGTEKDLFDD
jgi:hypothetical protein